MVNVGSRAPTCPLLLLRYARGGPLPYKASAPDQGTNRIDFQSGDPKITFLTVAALRLVELEMKVELEVGMR
jgi:hypothetical protein